MRRREKDQNQELHIRDKRIKELENDIVIIEQNSNVLKLRKEIERYKK